MRKLLLLFVLIISAIPQLFPQSSDVIQLAKVGDHIISVDEFDKRYSDFLFSTGIKDNYAARQSLLNGMISEILLINYDDNTNILSNNEYQKEINWVSKQSPLAYLKDQEVYAKITATDQELRSAFVRVNEKLAASHLYAQTLEEAEYLYFLVKEGVDWDNLAAQVFSDSTLRDNGGYLGYFIWGDMDPAFEEAAYDLKIGEISKPVKTETGYSIIRLDDRIPNPLITEYEFQNKKNAIERALRLKKKSEYEKKYLNSIFDESNFELNQSSFDKILSILNLSDISANESNAIVNDNTITVKYDSLKYSERFILDQLKQIPEYHRKKINTKELLKTVIKGIVIQQLLYQEVINKGYDQIPIVKEQTDKSKKQVFLKYKIQNILSDVQVSDSTLKEYYSKNKNSFKSPNKISIQEIIIDSKSKADSIYKLLLEGNDFGKLARENSIRKLSAINDGIIDYSDISRFGDLKKKFWESEIGKIISPIEISGFYGVFKILGKQEGKQKAFEDVKENAKSLYKFENKKLLVENYLLKRKQKIKITIDNKVLSSIKLLEKEEN